MQSELCGIVETGRSHQVIVDIRGIRVMCCVAPCSSSTRSLWPHACPHSLSSLNHFPLLAGLLAGESRSSLRSESNLAEYDVCSVLFSKASNKPDRRLGTWTADSSFHCGGWKSHFVRAEAELLQSHSNLHTSHRTESRESLHQLPKTNMLLRHRTGI